MYLERVGRNQVKIFITFEELEKHGVTMEDVGKDGFFWNQLLHKIVQQVCEEFDFSFDGMVTIDVFSIHGKEMIFLLTALTQLEPRLFDEREDFIPQKETVKEIFFAFQDIEDVIQFAQRAIIDINGGELYFMDKTYYLYLPVANETYKKMHHLILEYGVFPKKTVEYIREYAKPILKKGALEMLNYYFPISTSQAPV